MLLMIDNYDSFTYNVVQYLGELGADVHTVRNDQITLTDIEKLNPERIVLSPGPCTPNEAGISMDVVKHFAGKKPILGICLGHQCITQVYGGKIVHAGKIMHGKLSAVYHNSKGVFAGLDNPFHATRYHSLVAEQSTFPNCLEITAWSQNDDGSIEEIMGLHHKEYAIQGVQFHPESIMTQQGHDLLNNFLQDK